jgi:ribose transport system substrate-binding protein
MIDEGDWMSIARVQSPAMAAVAMKAVVALLKGYELPQLIGLEIPTIYSKDLEEGVNYWNSAPDNFQAGADVPACDVILPLDELLQQTPDNT